MGLKSGIGLLLFFLVHHQLNMFVLLLCWIGKNVIFSLHIAILLIITIICLDGFLFKTIIYKRVFKCD